MLEKDMEELIALYPSEFFPLYHFTLAGRQGSFPGVGRYDLLFDDSRGMKILMELKAQPAKYADAEQLAKYNDALKLGGHKGIVLWLVATNIQHSVREFLDTLGIQCSEIHVAEYCRIAEKYGYDVTHEKTIETGRPRLAVVRGPVPRDVRLADALFRRVQQRVLGILFGQPERSFLSKEVIALASSGTGAVHRELKRLAGSGLITVRSVGWEKHYQANRESPVFGELHALVTKTVGLIDPLREALLPLEGHIQAAFVFGSQARSTDTASSDVDLMIVSENLLHAEAYAALAKAEDVLARSINPTIISSTEWQQRQNDHNHFLENVSMQPKLFVLGAEDDLG